MTTAFRDGREHLDAELEWLDAGLEALMVIGGGKPDADPLAQTGMRGLVVTAAELADVPEDRGDEWEKYAKRRRDTERKIAERATASWNEGLDLPIVRLCRSLRLTVWERRCLVLCVAPEIHRKYEKWYAYLNDDVTNKAPTLDIALRLLCDSPAEAASARAALSGNSAFRSLLLEKDDAKPFADTGRAGLTSALRLDLRTVSFLLGSEQADGRLADVAEAFAPAWVDKLPPVPADDRATAALAGLRDSDVLGDSVPFVHLWGQPGIGKKLRLWRLASARRQRLLVVHADRLPSDSVRAAELLFAAAREAVMTDAALCASESMGHAPGTAPRHEEGWRAAFATYARFASRPLACWTSIAKRQPAELPSLPGCVRYEGSVEPPGASVRDIFWRAEASEREEWAEASGELLKSLAEKYKFTPGQIAQAWRQALALAAGRGADAPSQEELDDASRMQYRHRLAQLADPIKAARKLGDLILPPEPLALIREACNRFLNRETVFERWEFGRKLPYGKGLSLLLAGPPGTGKTMAAEIIAGELGLELYRIDLSRIVSKYIGETEQRLSELFAEAENSGAILFFDEGDALFGKRTEVKDAHDKYANMEAAYLLQRIEAYDGVAILATNLINNMDEALIRRMTFIIQFPFPGIEERERILRNHLPAAAPLSGDLDMRFLAERLEVSGGYLKNIVLASAFLASADGTAIGMTHFVKAARQELRKMGKILVKESFFPYFVE
ncbi:ATP-binding protein [Cohnella sp. GCM10027633]|uniref:ATP-binding protein n=1 Tax=unclassified Cohnella TaxID=2636738 RepID=UPI00362AB305